MKAFNNEVLEAEMNIADMKNLVRQLNEARNVYYNQNSEIMSDKEYDELFDHLVRMEKETGITLSDSPTVTVGYHIASSLSKVEHNHPMLSLDKTKDIGELKKWLGDQIGIFMLKMDGLTVSLRYIDGKLTSAETRGNGIIGEDVLHNAMHFKNVPLTIADPGEVVVDGEAIIDYKAFNAINNGLPEEERYKNPRNLASGSVRQLDSNIAAQRGIQFIAWKLVKGGRMENTTEGKNFRNRLVYLSSLGFSTVPFYEVTHDTIEKYINQLKEMANNLNYPIDGLVLGYDDVDYGNSLGATSHHLKSQIAFKFYEDEEVTTVREIEWGMGKTGVLTPVAVFDPVELNGTEVNKASLHNISIMRELDIHVGDEVCVYKANEIIPQIRYNNSLNKHTDGVEYPTVCPVCGGATRLYKEKDSTVLICTNDNCKGKLLGKLSHFVSRDAMDIIGLSESTLEKFIEKEWLEDFMDIYNLQNHYREITQMPGFGITSAKKLFAAIQKSKETTLERFIYALSIPMIGKSASKTIAKSCKGDLNAFLSMVDNADAYNWSSLEDFGPTMTRYCKEFFRDPANYKLIHSFAEIVKINTKEKVDGSNKFTGKVFVITGSVEKFKNRNELSAWIESNGGKVSGSVSKATSFLIANQPEDSSKYKKAVQLGIKIINEAKLMEMAKNE